MFGHLMQRTLGRKERAPATPHVGQTFGGTMKRIDELVWTWEVRGKNCAGLADRRGADLLHAGSSTERTPNLEENQRV